MSMRPLFAFFSLLLLTTSLSSAEEKGENGCDKVAIEEKSVEKEGRIAIGGEAIEYDAIAGSLVLKVNGCSKASFFYTAYIKKGEEQQQRKRPITFCFNGGPGSSSVWLHLGLLGPKKVALEGNKSLAPPYHLQDNEESILDVTDLVFIDPISTGYSKAASGEEAKKFHAVDKDIESVAEFIRLFVTKYGRWESPKFVAGESYGTTRAAGLAAELQEENFLSLNGILLISSVIDLQTILTHVKGNDLSHILFLPSYTTTAHYHKRLGPTLQKKSVEEAAAAASQFALTRYALALLKGDSLTAEEREEIESELSYYSGLSVEYIAAANLRVDPFQFRKELLRDERKIAGRFDSRLTGISLDPLGEKAYDDPSIDIVLPAYTATLNNYLQKTLGWKEEEKYEILTRKVHPWDWKASNEFLNMTDSLRKVMTQNRELKVFVASGLYDLATPFFATDYTFNHLHLDPSLKSNVVMKSYDGGHMMYIDSASLIKLNNDLREFIKQTLER